MTTQRVTHKQIEQACEQYNRALGYLKRGKRFPGAIQWADIRGDGSNRRGLYVQINADGGVASSELRQHGDTMRTTLRMINEMRALDKRESWLVIHRAIHFRGIEQRAALIEMRRRGLWLAPDQIKQAQLVQTISGAVRQPLKGESQA